MASISHNKKNGHRAVQFVIDGKRRTIRLGKMNKKKADVVKRHIEELNSSRIAGQAVDDDTAAWLAKLPDELHKKLADHGLTQPRLKEPRHRSALKAFADDFIAKHHVDPRTRYQLELARDNLIAFFGKDRPLETITKGEGKEWRQYLLDRGGKTGKPLGVNTVNARCKKARQIFNAAIDYEIIHRNPLLGLPVSVNSVRERQYFVTPEETYRLLEVCPTAEWRLLIALCRFAGLRNPSETGALLWESVDWDKGRMTVFSPKTKRYENGASREVPIFSRLRPYLEEVWDEVAKGGKNDAVRSVDGQRWWRGVDRSDPTAAADRSEFIVPRCRDNNSNNRTQLMRFMRRAGLEPWPRLFHNLRASLQTELEEKFPTHVVCSWLGNSPKVALEHYLLTTDDHFDRATEGDDGALQNALQQQAAKPPYSPRNRPQDKTPDSAEALELQQVSAHCDSTPAHCDSFQNEPIVLGGLEPPIVSL